ncbi:hypothetical protein GCM10010400_57510 [Streptomyces aculeolatus]
MDSHARALPPTAAGRHQHVSPTRNNLLYHFKGGPLPRTAARPGPPGRRSCLRPAPARSAGPQREASLLKRNDSWRVRSAPRLWAATMGRGPKIMGPHRPITGRSTTSPIAGQLKAP